MRNKNCERSQREAIISFNTYYVVTQLKHLIVNIDCGELINNNTKNSSDTRMGLCLIINSEIHFDVAYCSRDRDARVLLLFFVEK